MYRYFIFDVDGTLIDTEKTAVVSLKQTIKELLGKEMTYEEVLPYFGYASDAVGHVMHAPDTELFAHTWETHFRELAYMSKPFDGVMDMLAKVKASGKVMGFLTSRNNDECDYDINLRNMRPYFDCYVCADDSELHKPNPDPMLAYYRKLSVYIGKPVDPKDCIYIGDTYFDAGCAKAAGCPFALIDWYKKGKGDIESEYYFTSADDVLKLLNE